MLSVDEAAGFPGFPTSRRREPESTGSIPRKLQEVEGGPLLRSTAKGGKVGESLSDWAIGAV